MAVYNTGLHGIQYMEREQYDAADMDEKILYVVSEAVGFSLYLGNKELQLFTQLQQYQQTLQNITATLNTIKHRLGMMQYTYPDVNGDGEVGADDAQMLNEFSAMLGAGEYAEYDTIEEKWNAYAAENELENSQYIADVNGDGEMRADDVADILGYISDAGAGKYPNSEDGFQDYMLDKYNAFFGSNVTGIRVVTQEYYEQLEQKGDVLYFVTD